MVGQLRLDKEQQVEKELAERAVDEVRGELAQEEDPDRVADLKAELKLREEKLEELMEGFNVQSLRRPIFPPLLSCARNSALSL